MTAPPAKDERDRAGRLTVINDSETHTGHSVCGVCGKDMPACWDTVCAACHRTLCYDCSVVVDDHYWYCKTCDLTGAQPVAWPRKAMA